MINPYMLCLLAGVALASVSQILLKKSAMKTYTSIVREYVNPWVIGGYTLLFGSMVLNIVAYMGVDYKNGPVMESLGNVFVPLLSFFFLKERMNIRKAIGIATIMFGIFVFYS